MTKRILSKSSALYNRIEEALGVKNLPFQKYRTSLLSMGEAHADVEWRVKVTPADEKVLESLLFSDEKFLAEVRNRYAEVSRLYQEIEKELEKYDRFAFKNK